MKNHKKTILSLGFCGMFFSPLVHGTAPQTYGGHALLTPEQKTEAISQCAVKRRSVDGAYTDLTTVVGGEIQKNLPYVTPQQKEALTDTFLKTYKENPKIDPVGVLVDDFKQNLTKLEATLNKDPKATVEDSKFYTSQCGSLGSGIERAIGQQKSKNGFIATAVTDFIKGRYCPLSLTSNQVKTFQKDGKMTINSMVFYASKTTSGLSGFLAGIGVSSAKLTKLRSYEGSSKKTIACDYTSGNGTMGVYYEFTDLDRVQPF